MKTSVTVYQCDQCGVKVSSERTAENPFDDWFLVEKDVNRHFCSSGCLRNWMDSFNGPFTMKIQRALEI